MTHHLNPIKFLSATEYEVNLNDNYDLHKKGKYGIAFESEILNFILYLRDKENFDPQGSYANFYFIVN